MLKILSYGMKKLPGLKLFLQEELAAYADPAEVQVVAGWGYKPTAGKARALAAKLQVPYIAVEDGFLRSLDLGVNGAAPLSLTVDSIGCYYHAAAPSLLEHLMADDAWFTAELAARAERFIAFIKAHALSKYNCAPDFDPTALKDKGAARVLLVDQCAGDASLSLGLCPEHAAALMLKLARELYPEARLYVQLHPDVAAGKRQGLFDLKTLPADVSVLTEPAAPFTLLPHFKAVFTATSQLGFEALLQDGIKVHCVGIPFYAGYGLTLDENACERRAQIAASLSRSVEKSENNNSAEAEQQELQDYLCLKLAAALYFKLCRYINPVRAERCEAEEAAEILACQRQVNEENRGLKVVVGVKRWRRDILNTFLKSTSGSIEYLSDGRRALKRCQEQHGCLVQWASKQDLKLTSAAKAAGVASVQIEDGFMRSKGLGSSFYRPFSLVCDRQGIYYDPKSGSDLEQILNSLPERSDLPELQERAARLIAALVAGGLTKYNVGRSDEEVLSSIKALAGARQRILVPGQVESDASVRAAGGAIQTNEQLLQAVRRRCPQAFIIYKPHPDVLALNRSGIRHESACRQYADLMVANCSIADLYTAVDEVCVLSSQSGFEALLRGKKVTVFGRPFYAGWGLTCDLQDFPQRRARLSLEALAAGVLILYPRYYDWFIGQFCRPEDVCWRLEHLERRPHDSLWVNAVRGAYSLKRRAFRFFQGEMQ